MAMIDFTLDEHVATVSMNHKDNRLGPPFIALDHEDKACMESENFHKHWLSIEGAR